MSRRHPKRKTGGGRFAHIPIAVLKSQAVTALSHAAFRVLVLLAGEFTGANNGALGITKRQAKEQGIAHSTLYRALEELEERQLIEYTYPASRIPPRPNMYAITWRKIDDTEYSRASSTPSNAYRQFQTPPKKPVAKRSKKPRLRLV